MKRYDVKGVTLNTDSSFEEARKYSESLPWNEQLIAKIGELPTENCFTTPSVKEGSEVVSGSPALHTQAKNLGLLTFLVGHLFILLYLV